MNKVEKTTNLILNSFAGIVLFIVSLAAFYMPYEWRILPQVQQYLTPVRYVCGGLLILAFFFLYASSLTVFRGNWALFAALGFVAVLVFSTVMHQGDLEGALGTYGLSGLFLLLDIAVFFKVNPKKYILIAFFLLLLVNVVNTWTVFRYWGVGMWEEYGLYRNTFYSLVGNYNGGIEYVLPMAICGSAWASRYGKWLDLINYPAMVMSLIMAVKCDSLTQIVAFAAVLAFMIVGNLGMLFGPVAKVLRVIFQPIILMAVDFVIFVSVILINRTNWVANLGIDPDFHNRRHIWNMSMEWIKANPIWGSGQETVAFEATKITGYAHSHCTYLEVAYKTGFMGTVFMLLVLAAAIVAIYRNRHALTSYFLSILMFIFGLAAVAETYPMVYVLLCLGLIYYIAKNTNENEHRRDRIRQMRPVEGEDAPPDAAAPPHSASSDVGAPSYVASSHSSRAHSALSDSTTPPYVASSHSSRAHFASSDSAHSHSAQPHSSHPHAAAQQDPRGVSPQSHASSAQSYDASSGSYAAPSYTHAGSSRSGQDDTEPLQTAAPPARPVQTGDVLEEELESIGRKVREVQYEESPDSAEAAGSSPDYVEVEDDPSATRLL